ncbi:RHS repeat-associated core domain-containing protein [uncultured Amnibacterium sp.]|uniref:RHS repeat-associated core domain-containing protein n=1 Tax=uncultured Amnibacterium sp. TaxID=1631851 RepID=UPI0035C9E251
MAAQANVTYNSDGTVATAKLPGNSGDSTDYSYDSNHQVSAIDPVSGSSLGTKHFTYDVYGRLKTASDGAGRTSSYTYDDDDRLLTTAFSDSTATVTSTYDNAGNLTKQVSGGGTVRNTYDAFNRLLSTSNTAGGGTISYTYDKAGNRASMSTSKGTTNYVYDDSNVVTALNYPANTNPTQRPVTFSTDSNGRRTDEWLGTSSSWAGHVHTTYDQSGRISNVKAETKPSGTATTVIDVDYCYNTGGSGSSCSSTSSNDRSKLQRTYNHISGQTTTYTYDDSGRLTQVVQSGGSGAKNTYSYAYNANGDRISATTTGSSSASQTLTFNAADQITSSGYTFDGAGNLTASPGKTFTYNAAEQMTSATIGGVTYTYKYAGASQNALLSVTGNSQTRTYAYGAPDAVGNPQLEIFSNSTASSPTFIYNDPHTGQPLFTEEKATDNGALIVYDGTGNPVALLETWNDISQSNAYDPFGLATVSSGSIPDVVAHNPYSFKGGIQDAATGLIKFGQRWYAASTGAWTQQDTLDAPLDPANANRYAYAGNDPINGFDPTGFVTSCETSQQVTTALGTGTAIVAAAAAISAPTVIGGVSLGTLAAGGVILTGGVGLFTAGECLLGL